MCGTVQTAAGIRNIVAFNHRMSIMKQAGVKSVKNDMRVK